MCLVVLAWNPSAPRRLALVGHRDELHARPALPMHWWDAPVMLAGRDLEAGGTWLGADRAGRFGVVTNFRGGPAPSGGPSRGALIPRFLAGARSPSSFLAELAQEAPRYAGFSLLLGDRHELGYLCNAVADGPQLLAPGLHGLSNGPLDAPWPKVTRSSARLAARLEQPLGSAAELLELLADRAPAPDAELPDTGIGLEGERRLSPPFVVNAVYGTRAASALLLDADGGLEAVERTHAPDGSATGEWHFRLPAAGP